MLKLHKIEGAVRCGRCDDIIRSAQPGIWKGKATVASLRNQVPVGAKGICAWNAVSASTIFNPIHPRMPSPRVSVVEGDVYDKVIEGNRTPVSSQANCKIHLSVIVHEVNGTAVQ